MKILVTSDWHLDASTGGYPREDDLKAALAWVRQVAVDFGVDMVLFLGDLTDPDPNRAPRAAAAAVDFAVGLSKLGIASRWLVGNHDVIEDGSLTSTLQPLAGLGDSLVGLWSSPSFAVIQGVAFVALPYTPRASHYDATEELARILRQQWKGLPLVICGHLTVPAAAMGGESVEMAKGRDMVFPQLPPGVSALCLNGHYHKRQFVGGVHIPGALERLTFSEVHNTPGVLLFALNGESLQSKRGYLTERLTGMPGPGVKGMFVQRPPADVRVLHDVGPEHVYWTGERRPGSEIAGAIVRLCPPAGATDETIAGVHTAAAAWGVGVKLLPAPKPRAVPEAVQQGGARPRQGARSVIAELVAALAAAPRHEVEHENVRSLVERICEEAGL